MRRGKSRPSSSSAHGWRRYAVLGGLCGASGIVVAASTAACEDDTKPIGEVVLAVQTDVALPGSVDSIRVEITSSGVLQFSNDYPVGAGNLLIPATLGLLQGQSAATPVKIRLVASKDGHAKMVRDVITTVPSRIIPLRMPIRWLCDDSAKQEPTTKAVAAICPDGQTCIGGDCLDAAFDPNTAPDYNPADIYGGGDGSGNGQCFDVPGCLSAPTNAQLDLAACTIAKPTGPTEKINVALRVDGDGICDVTGKNCFVILDGREIDGWREDQGGDRIQLPGAVCRRFTAGRVKEVVTSTSCDTKKITIPTCGPWSSVKGGSPVGNASDGGVGPNDGGDAGDSGGFPEGDSGPPGILGTPLVARPGFLGGANDGPDLGFEMRAINGTLFYAATPSSSVREVWSVPLDGSTAPSSPLATYSPLVTRSVPLFSLANDGFYLLANTGVLSKYPLSGGSPTVINTYNQPGDFPNNAGVIPFFVGIDAENLYGFKNAPGNTGYYLYAIPLAGGAPKLLGTHTINTQMIAPWKVVADASPTGFVYVATDSTNVVNAPVAQFSKTATNALPTQIYNLNALRRQIPIIEGDSFYRWVTIQPEGNPLLANFIKQPVSNAPSSTIATTLAPSQFLMDDRFIYSMILKGPPAGVTIDVTPRSGGETAAFIDPKGEGKNFAGFASIAQSPSRFYAAALVKDTDGGTHGEVFVVTKPK